TRHHKGEGDEKGDVLRFHQQGQKYGRSPGNGGGSPGHLQLLPSSRFSPVEKMVVDVVGEGGSGGDHQSGHHGENGGKGRRRKEGHDEVAAQGVSQKGSRQISLGVGGRQPIPAHQRHRAQS